MSDWLHEDPKPFETVPPSEPVSEPSSASPAQAFVQPSGETAADTAHDNPQVAPDVSAGAEAGADQTTPPVSFSDADKADFGNNAVSGWQSSTASAYPPVSPVPPVTPVNVPATPPETAWNAGTTSSAGGWSAAGGTPAVPPTPPVSQSVSPPYSAYTPQGGYTPYGSWQPPAAPQNTGTSAPNGGQKPPRRKKRVSATAVIVSVLGVVCAATIVTLSVLLALAVNDGTPLVSDGGTTSSTQMQGTSSTTRHEDTNAPGVDISTNTGSGGLTTKQIIKKNLDSTVVLTMYAQTSSWGGQNSGVQKAGEASGIVMSADGYIITNRHCVINEEAQGSPAFARVDVTTYDGKTYEGAEIIGTDRYTDLAVIKINATGLTSASFGDSDALERGDLVVALGNPGGLRWTASPGIVSNLQQDVYEQTGYAIKCLQTDAAINPGNSGGPLLNDAGQVIGICSAKIVSTEYEGLGFAIPIKEAKGIIDDLTKYGYVKGRVMLSITGQDCTMTGLEGFQIITINSDSFLNNTEARAGDIITQLNGVRVKGYAELSTELSKHKAGDQITLTLIRVDSRSGQTRTIELKVTLLESRG